MPRVEPTEKRLRRLCVPPRRHRPSQRLNHRLSQQHEHRVVVHVMSEHVVCSVVPVEEFFPSFKRQSPARRFRQRIVRFAKQIRDERVRVGNRQPLYAVSDVLVGVRRLHVRVHGGQIFQRGTARLGGNLALLRQTKDSVERIRRPLGFVRVRPEPIRFPSQQHVGVLLVPYLGVHRLNLRLGEVDDETQVVLKLREGNLLVVIRRRSPICADVPAEVAQVRDDVRLAPAHVDDRHLRGCRRAARGSSVGTGSDPRRFEIRAFLLRQNLLRRSVLSPLALELVATLPHLLLPRVLLPLGLSVLRGDLLGGLVRVPGPSRVVVVVVRAVFVVELPSLLEALEAHAHVLGPHLGLHRRRHSLAILAQAHALLVPHLLQ